MPNESPARPTIERSGRTLSGWLMLAVNIALLLGSLAWIVWLASSVTAGAPLHLGSLLSGLLLELLGVLLLFGFFTLQPNEARVLILFGAYKGTVRSSGFHWANPFYARSRGRMPARSRTAGDGESGRSPGARLAIALSGAQSLTSKLSLRAQNFNSQTLKVNDKRGNPVEIAAVIVWRVDNTAQAVFDVEDCGGYVEIQSESAIRAVASRYFYDHGEEHEITLRGGADEVAMALKQELELRLAKAGVVVEEARLTHLAYAPEIAPAMLRRQQAESIVAARQIIVQNAVSMVQLALHELDEKELVRLDDERRAAMVSNLLVVLCGNSEASPVINTGTLYS